jgi:hypothetical protein
MGMKLRRFGAMMGGMRAMTGSGMGMVCCGIHLFVFIMLGGHAVMMRRLLVMLGGGMMMRAGGMLVRHGKLLWLDFDFSPRTRS